MPDRTFGRHAEKIVNLASAAFAFEHHFPLQCIRRHVAAFFIVGSRGAVVVRGRASKIRRDGGGDGVSVLFRDKKPSAIDFVQGFDEFAVVRERIPRESVAVERLGEQVEKRFQIRFVSIGYPHANTTLDSETDVVPPLLLHLREDFVFRRTEIEKERGFF